MKPITSAAASTGVPMYTVDAFAHRPFSGNPAAVCLLERPVAEEWMRRVASEMNLSETAFVVPQPDGEWGLRWFTPSVEVDLCGHATLASAHVLWSTGACAAPSAITFATRRSGRLTCRREEDGWIAMDFPARVAEAAPAPDGLEEALGCTPVWVGRSAYDLLVEVADAGIVQELKPDPVRLARLPVRGVIVTAEAGTGAIGGTGPGANYDFVSRFFAPGAGVPEDPVTGSAHCTLGPFWAARLGRTFFRAWQASVRGGEVRVRVAGTGEGARVELGGQAWTVLAGTLVPAE